MNAAIVELVAQINGRMSRRLGANGRALFEDLGPPRAQAAAKPSPTSSPWKVPGRPRLPRRGPQAALKLDGMAQAFVELEAQEEVCNLAHPEWLALLLDRENAHRSTLADSRLPTASPPASAGIRWNAWSRSSECAFTGLRRIYAIFCSRGECRWIFGRVPRCYGCSSSHSGEATAVETSIGWLLDPARSVRQFVENALEEAAGKGTVTPTMLRLRFAIGCWKKAVRGLTPTLSAREGRACRLRNWTMSKFANLDNRH